MTFTAGTRIKNRRYESAQPGDEIHNAVLYDGKVYFLCGSGCGDSGVIGRTVETDETATCWMCRMADGRGGPEGDRA